MKPVELENGRRQLQPEMSEVQLELNLKVGRRQK
jgi:hypothetical protein